MATGITSVTWGRVTSRFDRVLIVASGPSVSVVDPQHIVSAQQAGVYVIAVNHAGHVFPSADAWFTLDPHSLFQRMPPLQGGVHYLAIPDDFGTPTARNGLTDPPPTNATYLHRLIGNGVLNSKEGLSEDTSSIFTGNSAYGALGVAYHMRPKKIAILGVDGTKGYFYSPQANSGNLDHLPSLFASAVPQLNERGIEVLNGSPDSSVTCFRKSFPLEAIEWIKD